MQRLDVQEIKKVIPNRYPILYIDEVLSIEDGKKIVAKKNVTINEDFMLSAAKMPHTLVVETLAQAGSILILLSKEFFGKTAYIGGINEARFLGDILAGDIIELCFEIKKLKGSVGIAAACASVQGRPQVTCEFTFIVGEK